MLDICAVLRAVERLEMTDIVMLTMGIGFFMIALAYVAACDRL